MPSTENESQGVAALEGSIQVKGGKAVLKKYGKEHFSEIAKKRWKKARRAKALLAKQQKAAGGQS